MNRLTLTDPVVDAFHAYDLLATLVAVVRIDGTVIFANAALEDAIGTSRRTIEGSQFADFFSEPQILRNALEGAGSNEFAALRYDAWLKRFTHDPVLVHVIVAQTDQPGEVIIELLPLEQQARQDREERLIDQAQANKELIRNLAHEIKNPLGGIRGAAQLLQMEIESRDLIEYTQVIIHEADRLQTLVDRLLAPHRRPHVVGDAQITFRSRIARQVTFGKQRYRLALELHVIDNGPGVPDSIKDRIFYPLVSGRDGGSGLGLTLAQTFVQQHHGLIECDSVPGRTDFKMLIPLP